MLQAADALLSELGLNEVERLGVKELVIKKKIETMLAL